MDALSLADALEADADAVDGDRPQYESPGALASGLYPGTVVQTPALEMLDDALVDVAEGVTSRLMWFMSPQEGKSQRVSRWFPLWMLLRNPDLRIGIASYELGVARRWGRSIRNEIKAHPELGLKVRVDTSAAHEWELDGYIGGVFCTGVGGPLTGRPIDLMLIDDPVKGRAEADSEAYREAAKDWWQETVSARLGEHTPIVLVMCMTGGTPVLLPDGTERPLRDIRPGDRIATYDRGRLATSTVRNWANQGPDSVYEIRMKSGVTVRANTRHPFLTLEGGVETWRRTGSLRPGSIILRATGASTAASPAPLTSVRSLPSAKACATPTTAKLAGLLDIGHHPLSTRMPVDALAFDTGTASSSKTTTADSSSRTVGAQSVAALPIRSGIPSGGAKSCASITTTTLAPQPLDTFAIEPDEVVAVVPVGVEDVFDIQVDRTENFIANGLVSHNTRWHEDDLAGWLMREQAAQWRVVNIPALADHDPARGETDPLGREPGEWMLSARGRTVAGWEQRRKDFGERGFTALCQGRPSPAEGDMLKRGWWQFYRAPLWRVQADGSMYAFDMDEVIQSWDMSFKDTKASDYVVGQVWGRRGPDAFLLDQVRDRMNFPTTCRAVEALTAKWPDAHAKIVEDKANGSAVIDQLSSLIPGLIAVSPTESKTARVAAVSPFVESGNVYLPAPDLAPWVAGFIEECAGFPNASHDDQVDGMSQGVARLMIRASSALAFLEALSARR